ncbi:sugar O-acetyltransferase [Tumebacillus sp. DT12]|uniref:Sugar O-acetyltransferase n=1 Tax=Tumebacillus lacus TaxID=2995335 RepID=A0ABT3X6U8_9BACL|nr:sugar O-acetyltransferase [Tumebacillus lacus]MCX7571582.1 sugar O-acetyltransferase [Tumebacillus lacus]
MLAGELYLASDPQLVSERKNARRLTRLYNATTEDETEQRRTLLSELFGSTGRQIEVEPPFRCDYGYNIHAGNGFYANFNCVLLDVCEVRIGENVLFGPNVQVYTATHPLVASERIKGPELGKPITIGNNVWIGGGAIIGPGVTIGDNTTIGAGSVVTKDIPAGVFAAGNPCRVIREL